LNSTEDLKHLKRWILASYVKALKPLVEQGFEMFIEGDDNLNNKNPKHFELRVDGPYTRPCGTKGEMCSYIEVNLLGTSTRNTENFFDRQNLQGFLAFLLNRDVCILKTGNEGKIAVDDGSMVGVMMLMPSDQIKTSDFGMVDSNTEVYQCVSEAHYEMYH
jgi:hypothetical protein